jgi:hypothetical protein
VSPFPFLLGSLFWLDLCRVVLLMMAGWAYQLMQREDGRPDESAVQLAPLLSFLNYYAGGTLDSVLFTDKEFFRPKSTFPYEVLSGSILFVHTVPSKIHKGC